ncbi:MAG: universal stress protein [Bacteroidota bacterium]
MKKILLPTDFSDNAYNAIRHAVQLFKDQECAFYLLHTYTPAIYQAEYLIHSPGQIGLEDVHQYRALTQLNQLMDNLKKASDNPKHIFIPHAAFNLLVDEVLDTVEKEQIDLIVMGTQGATGAKEILFGTNAVHVIKKANCPVLVIPPNFEYETPKEILFPTDYEVEYSADRLKELIQIAQLHVSSIEVVHVSTGYELTEIQEVNKSGLDGILNNIAHLFHDMPSQDIIDAINNFQLKKKMNLLVMIKNKHTFLERLFIEPIIKKIGFNIKIPFMVIP